MKMDPEEPTKVGWMTGLVKETISVPITLETHQPAPVSK